MLNMDENIEKFAKNMEYEQKLQGEFRDEDPCYLLIFLQDEVSNLKNSLRQHPSCRNPVAITLGAARIANIARKISENSGEIV